MFTKPERQIIAHHSEIQIPVSNPFRLLTTIIMNSVATEMVSEGLEAMLASASRALEQAKEIIKVASPILDTTLSESDIQDVITYLDENQEANGYYYGDIGLLLLPGQQLPARLDRSLRYI